MIFHNLKPVELGALLWSMTWDGDAGLRHGLGMGKPFGFGQVTFAIDHENSKIIPNDPALHPVSADENALSELRDQFTNRMEQVVRELENDESSWREGERILNLLAMADPESSRHLPVGMQLRHMCMNPDKKISWQQVHAKQARQQIESSDLSDWLKEQLEQFTNHTAAGTLEELMRHGQLFKAWSAIEDPGSKRDVFSEIEKFWEEQGWWTDPPNKSVKKLGEKYIRASKKLE